MSIPLILSKTHIKGHHRTLPNGKRVWVKEHEDKRPRAKPKGAERHRVWRRGERPPEEEGRKKVDVMSVLLAQAPLVKKEDHHKVAATVSPSAKYPGKWQLTMWDEEGPYMDMQFDTEQGAYTKATTSLEFLRVREAGPSTDVIDTAIDMTRGQRRKPHIVKIPKVRLKLKKKMQVIPTSKVETSEDVAALGREIARSDREKFLTIHLDENGTIIATELVSTGSLIETLVHQREVFKSLLVGDLGTKYMILIHNHPSGDIIPSRADLKVTAALELAARNLGVKVIDHVIVSNGEYLSMADYTDKSVSDPLRHGAPEWYRPGAREERFARPGKTVTKAPRVTLEVSRPKSWRTQAMVIRNENEAARVLSRIHSDDSDDDLLVTLCLDAQRKVVAGNIDVDWWRGSRTDIEYAAKRISRFAIKANAHGVIFGWISKKVLQSPPVSFASVGGSMRSWTADDETKKGVIDLAAKRLKETANIDALDMIVVQPDDTYFRFAEPAIVTPVTHQTGEQKIEFEKSGLGLFLELAEARLGETMPAQTEPVLFLLHKAEEWEQIPGHKYIERKGRPGHYQYRYPGEGEREPRGVSERLVEEEGFEHEEEEEVAPLTKDERDARLSILVRRSPEMEKRLREIMDSAEIAQREWFIERRERSPGASLEVVFDKGQRKIGAELMEKFNWALNEDAKLKRDLIAESREQKASTEREAEERKKEDQRKYEEESRRSRAELEEKWKRESAEREREQIKKSEFLGKAEKLLNDNDLATDLLDPDVEIDDSTVYQAIGALLAVGVVRPMTRGKYKGQLQIDPTVFRELRDWNGDALADMKLIQMLTTAIYDDYRKRIYPGDPKAEPGTFGSLYWFRGPRGEGWSNYPPGRGRGYTRGRGLYQWAEKRGLGEKHWERANELCYRMIQSIHEYNTGESSNLEPLITAAKKPVEMGKKGKGEEAAKMIAQRERLVKAALKAQEDTKVEKIDGINYKALRGGDFYDYQKKGINWMRTVGRGVLAFDTGLGKTIATIGFLADRIAAGEIERGIIFVPCSMQGQWVEEIEKFTKGKKVVRISGNQKERKKLWRKAKSAQFVVCTYGQVQNHFDMPYLEKTPGAFIFDEGLVLKNPQNLSYRNVKKLLPGRKYAHILTATPIPNYPEDIYHQINIFHPGALGSVAKFDAKYVTKLRDKETGALVAVNYKDFAKLQQEIAPFCFYKKKSDPDVDATMPDLLNVREVQEMDPELKEYYEYGRQEAIKAMAGVENPNKMTMHDRANILAAITHMRQMVISPEVKYPEYKGPAPRLDAAVREIGAQLKNDPDHPIVVFSDFTKPFGVLRRKLAEELGLREEHIGEISGAVSKADRDEIRHKLNAGEIKVAMVSMKAGGQGLNLQGAANKVLFLHKPWTAALAEQSIARVWRPGQKNKVTAIHLHMRNTIEDRIEELLYRKKGLSAAVLEGEEGLAPGGRGLKFNDYMALFGISREELEQHTARQKAGGRERIIEGARKSLWIAVKFLRKSRHYRGAKT